MDIVKYFDYIPEILIYYHSECEIELNNLISQFNLNFRIIPVKYDIHGGLTDDIKNKIKNLIEN
jgi:tRNA(Ser,Leu) C12 N-acetylase TAN1